MTREKLLELQSSLISYLADPQAFEVNSSVSRPLLLDGIDPRRLELVGLLSQGKRIDKVMRLLPTTFSYLKPDLKALAREFALCHPPRTAESYGNACQFYMFLRRTWRDRPPDPPFLPDLVYCELALVSLTRKVAAMARPVLEAASPTSVGLLMIRRVPGVHLRRCQYNIRPLFNPRRRDAVSIARQPTCVIVTRPLNAGGGRAFGVDEGVFEIVRSLKNWRAIRTGHSLDSARIFDLLRRMEGLGILEVRRCASA